MFNRIKELRKILKLSQTEFAQKIGIGMRTIQDWEAGKTQITKESSLRLIESTFNVNPMWLREGKGEMFANSANPIGKRQKASEVVQYRFYPDVYASAGNGYMNTDENYELMPLSEHLSNKIGHPQYIDMIQVYGDSMEPKYRSNDWLFVDKRYTQFSKEGIYVILNEGVLMVKYLQKIPKGIRIHSLNKEYADIDYLFEKMNDNDLIIVGIVRGAITFNQV